MNKGIRTRQDLVDVLFTYLNPLLMHYSKDEALLYLSGGGSQYESEVIPMEAWARPLWGLAPFWSGGGRSSNMKWEKLYLHGLISGTNPHSIEYWGSCRDHDQRFVEMAAIAYGLLLAPEVLWQPLGTKARIQVATWLRQINEHSLPEGNWLIFRVLVNLALITRGAGGDEKLVTSDLDVLNNLYIGNGWYQDGPNGLPDYYNAMTFQSFSLFYIQLLGDRDAARTQCLRERTRLFAKEYLQLFSARGEAVPYGRSMTYRFAQSGFWSMAVATRADLGVTFTPKVLKGLIMRNIGAWDRKRICDNGDVLTIGYHYPNLHMAEGYNAAGSSFWALMAFACLALPESDPFWEIDPESFSSEPSISCTEMGVVKRNKVGEVVLYPSGCVPGHPLAQSNNKYSKFCYSSQFGFSVARSQRTLEEAAPDSMLAFVINDHIFVRDSVEKHKIRKLLEPNGDTKYEIYSVWSPWVGIKVETTITPIPGGQLRCHHVTSTVVCKAFDCGFAVPGDYHQLALRDIEHTCCIRSIGEVAGKPVLIKAEANTNISCGKTLIPAVSYDISQGTTTLMTRITVNEK